MSNVDESIEEVHHRKDEYDQEHAIIKDEDKYDHEQNAIETTLVKFSLS